MRKPFLFNLILLTLVLVACEARQDDGRVIVDGLGRAVVLPDSINRIASLAPNVTEILFAAGVGDRVVAVTTADDFPPSTASIPRFAALPVDFEAVLAYEPDIIFASAEVNSSRDAVTLEEMGLPVFFFTFAEVDDILSAIERVGEIMRTPAEARAAADSLRDHLRSIEARSTRSGTRPRVLPILSLETLYSFGGDSYVNEMIKRAGGESITTMIDSPAPVLSDEFVLDADPDVIVVASEEETSRAELLRQRPSWQGVRAVRDGRVHFVHPDLLLRPGPRVVDGVETLYGILSGNTTEQI